MRAVEPRGSDGPATHRSLDEKVGHLEREGHGGRPPRAVGGSHSRGRYTMYVHTSVTILVGSCEKASSNAISLRASVHNHLNSPECDIYMAMMDCSPLSSALLAA